MPLSRFETTTYTKMFKESPSLTGNTMTMENVVKLCRDLGWSEKEFSTATIQSWTTKKGPLNLEEFLKMFDTALKKDVRKARYRRDFAAMDVDGSGKVSATELAKYVKADEDSVTDETARARAKDVLAYADKDKDKQMDLNEFLSMML